MRIYLVRHARAAQPPGIVYGALDNPADLTDTASIHALCAKLPRGAHWFTSPARRCTQTAEHLMNTLGSSSSLRQTIPEFVEQNFGVFEGQSRTAAFPQARTSFWLFPRDYQPPGGESFDEVRARVVPAFARIANSSQGDIVIVTHGNVIRALLDWVLDLAADIPSKIEVGHLCAVTLFARPDGFALQL